MSLSQQPDMYSNIYARVSDKAPKGLARMHSGEPNQILPKFWMQYVSKGTLPSFSSVLFPKKADVSDKRG